MEDTMKRLLKEKDMMKSAPVTLTMTHKQIADVEKEQERLGIKTRSKMLSLMVSMYFELPLNSEGVKK